MNLAWLKKLLPPPVDPVIEAHARAVRELNEALHPLTPEEVVEVLFDRRAPKKLNGTGHEP